MSEPTLDGTQINTFPQMPGCEGRTKLVQKQAFTIRLLTFASLTVTAEQARSFRNSLQRIQEIKFWVATGRRKDQGTGAVRLCLPPLQ
jgi:hypothetical protein